MLNVQTIQLLVTGGVVGAVLGFLAVIPYLKKKGIDITKGIDTVNDIIKGADPVINAASALLPNKTIDVLKTIEKWVIIAVGYAQQLYHTENIGKDERKKVAQDVVYKMLGEFGIELTESRQYLINAAIENAVNDLGHEDPTEAEKQAQKQELQTKVIQLTTENTNLKNTINDINNAVSTVKSDKTITQ